MNLFAVMYAYVPDPFRWLETFPLMEHMTLMMKLPNTIGNVCIIQTVESSKRTETFYFKRNISHIAFESSNEAEYQDLR